MAKVNRKGIWAWSVLLFMLFADQIAKVFVKLNFYYRESVEVTPWFYISFIENNGMAYGIEIVDKLFLTLFRLVAVAAFGYVLWKSVKRNAKLGLVISLAMIVSGALGNIIDCIVYGRIFTDSNGHIAQWAVGGLEGYAPWFRGRVVDMLYFPLIQFSWPDWVPATGEVIHWGSLSFSWPRWLPCSNEDFLFFQPVFNVADAAISIGVAILILFYRKAVVALNIPFIGGHSTPKTK